MADKIEVALAQQTKLLNDLIKVLTANNRGLMEPYKPRSSRGVGAKDYDAVNTGNDVKETRQALNETKSSLHSFNKGLIQGIPLARGFFGVINDLNYTFEKLNKDGTKFSENTINSAKKLAKQLGTTSQKFEEAAKKVSRIKDMADDILHINNIQKNISKDKAALNDLEKREQELLVKIKKEHGKLVKKQNKEALEAVREEIKAIQKKIESDEKLVDVNEDLIDEFLILIDSTDGVNEAFNGLDDTTKAAIKNLKIKSGLDKEQEEALKTTITELNQFGKAVSQMAQKGAHEKNVMRSQMHELGRVIGSEAVGFVKNTAPGILDRYVVQMGASIQESSYANALLMGMDERQISELASRFGRESRVLSGSSDRTALFTAGGFNEVELQKAIRQSGYMFGLQNAEAAERALQLSGDMLSSGMLSNSDALLESSAMLNGLASAVGSTSNEMYELMRSMSSTGHMAMIVAGQTEEEAKARDKSARAEFAQRVKNLKLLGLQNEEVERAMKQSNSGLFSGLVESINKEIGMSMALETFGASVNVPGVGEAINLNAPENAQLRRDLIDMNRFGINIVPDDRRSAVEAAATSLRQNSATMLVEAASRGDRSAIDNLRVMRDIIGGKDSTLIMNEEALAQAARGAAGVEPGVGLDSQDQFMERILSTGNAALEANTSLLVLEESLIRLKQVIGDGFGANPLGGAISSIGGVLGSALLSIGLMKGKDIIWDRIKNRPQTPNGPNSPNNPNRPNQPNGPKPRPRFGKKGAIMGALAALGIGAASTASAMSDPDYEMTTDDVAHAVTSELAGGALSFIVGRITGAAIGAATGAIAGTVAPGAGNVVGGIVGLGAGLYYGDDVADVIMDTTHSAMGNSSIRGGLSISPHGSAVVDAYDYIFGDTKKDNNSIMVNVGGAKVPPNWNAMDAETRSAFLDNMMMQKHPNIDPSSPEYSSMKAQLDSQISSGFDASFYSGHQPGTYYDETFDHIRQINKNADGTITTTNLGPSLRAMDSSILEPSSSPLFYQQNMEEDEAEDESVTEIKEKSPLEKLMEKMLEILEGVEENTKETAVAQKTALDVNITDRAVQERIDSTIKGLAARQSSLSRNV